MRFTSIPLLASLLASCSQPNHSFNDGGNRPDVADARDPGDGGAVDVVDVVTSACPGPAGSVVCRGTTAITCDGDGGEGSSVLCRVDQVCVPGRGCRMCAPGAGSCADDVTPQTCNATADGYDLGDPCPPNQACGENGACVDLCTAAAARKSYIGCDYWTTTTANASLGIHLRDTNPSANVNDLFPFAIAVANPQSAAVTVTVTGGQLDGRTVTQDVAANSLAVIKLPWVDRVAQQYPNSFFGAATSVFAAGGGYHVTSTAPVTVYQFNPLSYRDETRTSCDPLFDTDCFSFTNDASLLLPTSVLSGNVTVVSYPSTGHRRTENATGSTGFGSGSGYMTIVATADNTRVSVQLAGFAEAAGGSQGGMPGQTLSRTMNAGDVWQLMSAPMVSTECQPAPGDTFDNGVTTEEFCPPVPTKDLTGSVVTASAPVAVFGGHDCALVPYNRYACDHLEEELFPNETLGTHYVVSRTQPQLPGGEPNVVRIVSNQNGNVISFAPASAHEPVTLDRGQYADFTTAADLEVTGTGPLAVAQFFVGQNYFGNDQYLPPGTYGDPSMVLEVPVEQWRNRYEFLAPATYPATYVNVVAPASAVVVLDGAPVAATPATVNGYYVYRLDISNRTGAHEIHTMNAEPFSIKVYGFGAYTSYMYPGGLDLAFISPPG